MIRHLLNCFVHFCALKSTQPSASSAALYATSEATSCAFSCRLLGAFLGAPSDVRPSAPSTAPSI